MNENLFKIINRSITNIDPMIDRDGNVSSERRPWIILGTVSNFYEYFDSLVIFCHDMLYVKRIFENLLTPTTLSWNLLVCIAPT